MTTATDAILMRTSAAEPRGATASRESDDATVRRDGPTRPLGSISIDLDTLRDYAPGYGFTFERPVDPVFESALPRFLDLLRRLNVPTTLFTIGRDTKNTAHAEVLRRAFNDGHEPGNHTMTHPRRLSKLPIDAMRREIFEAHETISTLAGRAVVGFRAPCYDISGKAIGFLNDLGYRYDSSVHPTILGPVVDAVVFVKSRGRSREWRPGTYAHAFAPLRPYAPNRRNPWRETRDGTLIELPLSAVPRTRMPFYGTWTHATGKARFDRDLRRISQRGSILNFHFHAVELLDLADPGVDPRFRVHPGLSQPLAERAATIEAMIRDMAAAYELVTLSDLATNRRIG